MLRRLPHGRTGSRLAPAWPLLSPFWSLLVPLGSTCQWASFCNPLSVSPLCAHLSSRCSHSLIFTLWQGPQISVSWVPFGGHFVSSGSWIAPLHWSCFRRVWVPLAAHFASSGLLIAPWGSSWLSFVRQGPKICAFWCHLEGQFKLRAPVWRSFHAPDLRP